MEKSISVKEPMNRPDRCNGSFISVSVSIDNLKNDLFAFLSWSSNGAAGKNEITQASSTWL